MGEKFIFDRSSDDYVGQTSGARRGDQEDSEHLMNIKCSIDERCVGQEAVFFFCVLPPKPMRACSNCSSTLSE